MNKQITFEMSPIERFWNWLFPLKGEHWCWCGFGWDPNPVFSFLWLGFFVLVYDDAAKRWAFEKYTD